MANGLPSLSHKQCIILKCAVFITFVVFVSFQMSLGTQSQTMKGWMRTASLSLQQNTSFPNSEEVKNVTKLSNASALTSNGSIFPQCESAGEDPRNVINDNATALLENSTFQIADKRVFFTETITNWCAKHEVNFVLIVISSPRNQFRRQSIRKSWAKHEIPGISVVFLIGQGTRTENMKIAHESDKLGDVIRYHLEETYENLVYKSLVALQWAVTFCRRAAIIGKVDDDVFLNVFRARELIELKTANMSLEEDPLLVGRSNKNFPVFRHRGGKWSLTRDQFSPDTFPEYTAGMAYFVNRVYAVKALVCSRFVIPVRIEDVFVTGILRVAMGAVEIRSFEWGDGMFATTGGYLQKWMKEGAKSENMLAVLVQDYQGLLMSKAFQKILGANPNRSAFAVS